MIKSDTSNQLDLHSYLPPYRSLLSPHARYDYRTHTLIPITQNDWSLPFLVGSTAAAAAAASSSSSSGGNTNSGAKSKFKMKYKSLLSDVSRRTSILSLRKNLDQDFQPIKTSTSNSFNNTNSHNVSHSNNYAKPQVPVQFKNLPIEILEHILELVDDFEDYKCCLLINKQFYQLTKPLFYRSLSFTSTYKFALFVTYLRLNSEVGCYVKEIDLSGIKPSNFGIDEEDEEIEEEAEHRRGFPGTAHGGRQSLDEYQLHHEEHTDRNYQFVLAGWRDWKFKSNPLYSTHQPSTPASSVAGSTSGNLTKIRSNSQALARSLAYSVRTNHTTTNFSNMSSSSKIVRLSKYFKNRKRQRIIFDKRSNVSPIVLNLSSPSVTSLADSRRLVQQPHPSMNKFLFNYSSYKDVPIGYVLHTLNLCPNLVSINLANLSLSADYEIDPEMAYKYQTYDLMNNYSKDLVFTINKLMSSPINSDESIYSGQYLLRGTTALSGVSGDKDSLRSFQFSAASVKSAIQLNHMIGNNNNNFNAPVNSNIIGSSSASSLYSFHPPARPRYNSLLPPLPQSSVDTSYTKKGDGKVFLSDLNLKSINNNYLTRIQEKELLTTLAKIHSNRFGIYNTLKYVNFSSMIWLTKGSVKDFISEFLSDDPCMMSDDDDESSLDTSSVISTCDDRCYQDLVIDLTDSGMYKNLLWAKRIDLKLVQGFRLATKIVRDEVLDVNEYNTRRDQVRRGRIGENYFS